MGRFFMIKYTWSETEKKRYDRHDHSSRGLHVHKRTSIVSVSFVRLSWGHGSHSRGTRPNEYVVKLIAQRSSSIIVCDMFPIACIRQSHARFVLSYSELLSRLSRRVFVSLKHGVFDQYVVSEDELVDVIINVIDDDSRTSIGLNRTMIQSTDYCCFLEEALSLEVVDWTTTIDESLSD